MKGAWLEDLTWAEARERFDRGDAVVIPVAAAARAQGPHLLLGTAALIARAFGQQLIERLPVIAAPVVGLGVHPAVAAFAGSQALSRETFSQAMREMIDGLRRQGVRRFIVLDFDGACNEPDLHEPGDVLVLQPPLLDAGLADQGTTSIVLALAPRSVRMELAILPDGSPAAPGKGDPGGATAFKGERLLDARIEEMVQAVIGRWPSFASCLGSPMPRTYDGA